MLNLITSLKRILTGSKGQLPLTMVPSLPAATFTELQALTAALAGVSPGFQIDIVDGKFAPHTSWPFTEPDGIAALLHIRSLPQQFTYELDCMVEQPEQYFDVIASLPLAKVIVHLGSTEAFDDFFAHAETHGYEPCVAFTNDVSLNQVHPLIAKGASVQIMGIAQVGAQGQPFDERTITTARALRARYPRLSIAVDGSVNADTIPKLIDAGVNHFAPGSAISQAEDPAAAYRKLSTLLKL